MKRNEFKTRLARGLDKMEVGYNDNHLELLWIYKEFLLSENKKYNLTSITEPDEVITKHFLDSLAITMFQDFNPGKRMVDIGTGAGFPGLVLKIFFPDTQLILVDSLAKRIKFLNELVDKLGLQGINTIHERAEELGQNNKYREKFDSVISRAVASLNILSEYTLPLSRIGGSLFLYKGPDYINEIKEAENAISLLGGKISEIKNIEIPFLSEKRFIIKLTKKKKTPPKYPRRAGIPKKRPL